MFIDGCTDFDPRKRSEMGITILEGRDKSRII
jgi:hypothetical protein